MSKKAQSTKEKTVKVVKEKKVKAPKGAVNIHEALFNFQAESITIPRNGTGTINGRQYKYAILDDISAIIKPFLQKHRILITQLVEDTQLLTKIIHVDSGTEIIAPLPFTSPKSAQDLGSQITYLRRYAIVAALGLIVDQDIDGAVPDAEKKPQEQVPTENKVVPTTVSNPTPTVSEAYNKAHQAVLSASSQEAIELLMGQVERSTRLNDKEKADLKAILEARDTELHGTVR